MEQNNVSFKYQSLMSLKKPLLTAILALLTVEASDAARVIKNAVIKRNIKKNNALVVRSDNGPQFRAKVFSETMETLGVTHERTPINTSNMNAYRWNHFTAS